MSPVQRQRLRGAGLVLAAVAVLGVLVGVGFLVPRQPEVALLGAMAVLSLGVASVSPSLIPLACLPLLVLVVRVGAGGVGVSVSDIALAAAFLPAVVFGRRPFSPPLRTLLWLNAVYQFATLFTVVDNPYTANAVEWVHAWLLVSGALVVGWTIGRHGRARLGLTLLVLAILVLAVITLGHAARQYARGDFSEVYVTWPYAMHKNFVGTMCALGATIAYVRPSWWGWSSRLALPVFAVLTAAILVSQSRQALLGLVAAIAVLVLRSQGERRRSKLVLLLAVPAVVFVSVLVRDQVRSGNQFNSVFQRLNWFEESVVVWGTDPWFGAGLRWWYTDRFAVQFQPPNAAVEVLTSAGIVGLAAFLLMIIGALVVLHRVDPVYGTLALTVLVCRLVQTQFDLYWVASQGSVPFVVVGVCLGVQALAAEESARSAAVAAAATSAATAATARPDAGTGRPVVAAGRPATSTGPTTLRRVPPATATRVPRR